MSKYQQIVEHIKAMNMAGMEVIEKYRAMLMREKLGLLDAVEKDIERCRVTGVLTFSLNQFDIDTQDVELLEAATTSNRSSEKENIPATNTISVHNSPRPKRNAFEETRRMSNIQSDTVANKTSNIPANDLISNVTVKTERLSKDRSKTQPEIIDPKLADLNVKKEMIEMPPPLNPPIRQTRGRRKGDATNNAELEPRNIKIEQIAEEEKKRIEKSKHLNKQASTTRDSDVQIKCEPIQTINLVDSEEDEKPRRRGRPRRAKNADQSTISDQETGNIPPITTFSTRMTRNAAAKNKEIDSDDKQKRMRSPSTEDDVKNKKVTKAATSKKTRTDKAVENNHTEDNNNKSVYESAASNDHNMDQAIPTVKSKKTASNRNELTKAAKTAALNETVVVDKSENRKVMNQTVVISKETENNTNFKDIMTDDEDVLVSPPKDKKLKLKQVFSPYSRSPVKQRVQAFEKLQAEASNDIPPRMTTRTKTKAKAKEQEENHQPEHEDNETLLNNGNRVNQGAVPKARNPPTKKGSIPVLRTTPVSDNRILTHLYTADRTKHDDTLTTVKSAIKSSQAEYREREMRRMQKEAEAISKKEALIQALTEERKRKREERQLKAQQTRDAIEKDKQKVLESAERIKREKIKQMLAEKEDKLLKQKEAMARKRAAAQKKAAEEKLREEQGKKQKKNDLPPYLKYETPLLPTEDCYDSDDPNGKPFSVPAWQKKDKMVKNLKCMRFIGVKKGVFFCNGPTTVNLQEIFPSIESHKLKRTSSAIWNRSGMLQLTSLAEMEEGDDAA